MAKELVQLQSYKDREYKICLEEIFLKMDVMMLEIKGSKKPRQTFREEDDNNDPDDFTEAGCTSNVILITRDKIYCANAGDSRAVMC